MGHVFLLFPPATPRKPCGLGKRTKVVPERMVQVFDGTFPSPAFIDDVRRGRWKDAGWPESAYGMSKVGVTMYTRIAARDSVIPNGVINACCPGWVRTAMAGNSATKSPDEGARTPVKLALLDAKESTNGKFWEEEQPTDLI